MMTESNGSPHKRLTTEELQGLLEAAPQLSPVLKDCAGNMQPPTFSEHLAALMDERGLNPSKLGELALLSRSFAYQLCSGIRSPSRDVVLRLALVLRLTPEEAQRLLRTACRGALYPRVRRDAVFIFALKQGLSLFDANELLCSLSEAPIL